MTESWSYLETDFIRRLFCIFFNGVGRRNCRSVDGPVLADDQSMPAVVQLQPVQHGTAGDHGTGEMGEAIEIIR